MSSSSRVVSARLTSAFACALAACSLHAEAVEGPNDDLALIKKIRAKIIATSGQIEAEAMKPYQGQVPETAVDYAMVNIAGGEFLMGSAADEEHRADNEGPQRQVAISPFWMGKCEVTWDEYEPFMITNVSRNKDGSPALLASDAQIPDAISKPTTPYTEMSFGMGTKGFPAISMTQHAALKYCQWLSAQTGHFYRLPTEAEWEYACRAGTTTTYSWGDDPTKIGDFAWYWDNCDGKYQLVGKKKPNPWGLHDMHGNVIEWVLDGYQSYPAPASDKLAKDPLTAPQENLYPRVARGGSWYDGPELLRSAARFQSSSTWKIADPQLPKSIWYHTSALWLGFRLVRPLQVPSAEEMHRIWNSGRGIENG